MNRFIARPTSVMQQGLALLFLLASGLFAIGTLHAAPLALANSPLDVQQGVPPNILLTFDTSGSMASFFMPDSGDDGTRARDANSDYNKLYYDPTVTYSPSVDENGTPLANGPTFTAAWPDGYDHTVCSGNTINLATQYFVDWASTDDCNTSTVTTAAYYYVKNNKSWCTSYPTTDDTCYDKIDASSPTFDQQNFANWFSYYRSRILMAKTAISRAFASSTLNGVRMTQQTLATTTIPAVVDFSGAGKTNFYSTIQGYDTGGRTPTREAFIRAGQFFSQTQSATNTRDPYLTTPGVTQTTGTEYACRQNFHIAITDGYWNESKPPSASTPDYPWKDNLGSQYDDNAAITLPDTDGITTAGITTLNMSTSYTPTVPYADNSTSTENDLDSNTTPATRITTLADIAFYYWAHDLRADLDNSLQPYLPDTSTDYDGSGGAVTNTDMFMNPQNDPATWQHMVNFTIPLGLAGNMSYDPTNLPDSYMFPFVANSATTGWSAITSQYDSTATADNAKIDDLWHAAINSRGGFFTASDPNSLVSSLGKVLGSISSRTSSASALATSLSTYQAGTSLYQAVYDTSDWHGDLVAYDVTNTTTPLWNASTQLNGQTASSRVILSYNPLSGGAGIPFEWASLNATQQGLLTSNSLDYLRGDKSNEQSNGGTLRNRAYTLGDIVHSAPEYVGPPNRLFPDTLETAPYSAFKTTYTAREPIVYVGANDGMLHGFDANTGIEKIAYVPSTVYSNLASLSSPTYSHKFFVDGTPTSRDVFYGGNWHTVLVGGLNGGGQGIYALDITNPANFTEGNAASLVLWEYTDTTDTDGQDLGYTFSAPTVGKMNNSQWAAIFGNGYNNTQVDSAVSTTGNAVLYIRNIQTGAKIVTLDTGVGMAQDPTGANRPNGLSTVALVDANGDYTVDYIYAGDLFGNLWKFDVHTTNPALWTVAKSNATTNAPLFVATDASGNRQPITSAPVVGLHGSQAGFMVNFGTGKYLETNDLSDTSVQSFYGVWDRNEAPYLTTITRSEVFAQTILDTNTTQFANNNAGITSDTTFDWYIGSGLPASGSNTYLGWYMDLLDPTTTPPAAKGERVIDAPTRIGNRIIFVSNVSSPDPCLGSGSSWITELNASNGMRLPNTVFDYNGDYAIGTADFVQYNGNLVVGSRIQIKGSAKLSGLTILVDPTTGNEVKLSSAANATVKKILEAGDQQFLGRRAWIQLLSK